MEEVTVVPDADETVGICQVEEIARWREEFCQEHELTWCVFSWNRDHFLHFLKWKISNIQKWRK
jgi:hypothetical protein